MNSWTDVFAKDAAELMRSDDSIDTRGLAVVKPAARAAEREPEVPEEKPAQLSDADAKQVSSLVDGLDRIETSWITQLGHIKHNADVLERKIHACVLGLRQDMARLELLGQQAMKEAERGRKVAQHFVSSLDQIKGGR